MFYHRGYVSYLALLPGHSSAAQNAVRVVLALVHHHADHTTLALRPNEYLLSGSGQPAEVLALVGARGIDRVTSVDLLSVPY